MLLTVKRLKVLSKLNLTIRQLGILYIAYRLAPGSAFSGPAAPPINFKVFYKELGISKPAASRAMDTLGIKGFVRRERNEKDLREVWIHTTDKGRALLDEIFI